MNRLKVRPLPLLSTATCKTQEYKQRIDPVLVRLVHESVQRRAPHLKVGKRVALEYVLLQYLGEHNLLKEYPAVPGLLEKDPLAAAERAEKGAPWQ